MWQRPCIGETSKNHLNWHDYCWLGVEEIPLGFFMFYIMKIKLINIIQ